ncbi:MAG: thioredoxin [Bacillota bacterium]
MNSNIIELTSKNFHKELETDLPVLIDFWAPWCMPCRMIGPTIEILADQYRGMAKVCKLNVDNEPALAAQFGVMSIPTVVVMKNGIVCDKQVGALPKQHYSDMLNKCVKKAV